MGLLNIYNASAGSGKTYTLVYNYLCILFTPSKKQILPPADIFKTVLAITFTNKAAWEMKSRIISTLEDFSTNGKDTKNDMFFALKKHTGLSDTQIQKLSGDILSAIYSDYSAFAVCTIDSFTTRLVRSFSRELKLPIGFNIVVDASDILSESIDMLLLKAGKDNEALTFLLLNFVTDKIDDGQAWDISSILENSGNIWDKEDSIEPLDALSSLKIKDYADLMSTMRTFTSGVEKELKQMGENACQLVNSVAPPESFYQGAKGIVSLFNKAKNGDFSGINLYGSYVSSFLDGKYCSSKASGTDKNSIENAAPELIDYYHQIQNVIEKNAEAYNFIKILYAPLKKISVAQQIKSEVDDVKKRSSTMLLREFNEIISHHLRNEPAPFIYEKIGERYRHYFIDEFQDTSHLQWENLKHLVFNQIAGSGSALIVGDAKQAIYRWRGGDSEQFIDLCEGKTELPNEQLKVQDLDTNYRSSGVIVDFTNQFFSACTPFLSDEKYQNLYLQGNRQKSKKTFNGFVSITDIQGKTESERTPLILDSVINEIKRVLSDGFSYRDIAILYRSNAVGGKIASALAEKGIPIVSTESLLLSESSYVGFAIAVLRFVNNPTDRLSRASILNYLEKTGKLIGFDVTQYKAKSITSATKVFLDTISSVVSGFNADTLFSSPLYEMVEYIMHVFSLWDNGQDAYLLRLLDYVEEFSSQNASSVSSFLSHWDKVKEKISISSPSDADAVRLLTIHKSKGLEYPVVIFPFASWNIKEDEEVWVKPPKNDIFNALPTSYIKLSDVKKAGLTDVASPYESKIKLDNMNIFYVAMTRPSHQLHIITTINEKSGISQCFSMFLDKTPACHDQDPDNIYVYSCGERRLEKKDPDKVSTTYILKNMGCVLWKDRLKVSLSWKKPWSTTGESAIEYGNKLHEILSSVDTSDDVEIAVGRAVVSGTIDQSRVDDVVSAVKSIVTHPLLKDYYSSEYTAMNERELLTPDGDTLRPDRVCLNGKNAVVIDYKTGAPKNAHKNQVLSYTSVLQSIGYSVEKCLLVYINDKGIMVEQV